MINSTYDFIIEFFRLHPEGKTLLDVGSRDVGGGHIKNHIPRDVLYTGVDMMPGENVDIVLNGHDLLTKFSSESFDVVTCFDTFEHDDKFWLTWDQIKQVIKRGGYGLIAVPGRFCPLHEHPGDYWRFMPSCMDQFFSGWEDKRIKVITSTDWNQNVENEIYGWGRKP